MSCSSWIRLKSTSHNWLCIKVRACAWHCVLCWENLFLQHLLWYVWCYTYLTNFSHLSFSCHHSLLSHSWWLWQCCRRFHISSSPLTKSINKISFSRRDTWLTLNICLHRSIVFHKISRLMSAFSVTIIIKYNFIFSRFLNYCLLFDNIDFSWILFFINISEFNLNHISLCLDTLISSLIMQGFITLFHSYLLSYMLVLKFLRHNLLWWVMQ